MKFRFFLPGVTLAALFLFSSYTLNNSEEKNLMIMRLMMQGMHYYHYQPQEINDSFSSHVFDQYLKKLDYNKRFLTRQDVDNLRRYQYLIDEEISEGTYELFDLSLGIYGKRLDQAEGFYKEILAQPFDFSKDEELKSDPDKLDYAQSEAEIRERWRRVLKYQTMIQLFNLKEKQEKAQKEGDGELELKTDAQLEEEARDKVLKNNDSYFYRLRKIDRDDRMSDYMNAIAEIFDPHTGYFPPKDKANFDIAMSGQLEGIGAQLRDEDGYIKVVSIVPGSACSRQGDLEVGDIITKVGQSSEDPVDVVDMDIDDAIKMIRGPKGSEVRLTVQKIDNSTMVIPIIRDVVVLEETYAKSAILEAGKDKESIGYIHLPKFYVNFNSRDGRRCATDVAKEIEKLKEAKVDGIILDLRNNGGGSLNDVVEMAGLFIEKGPIVQVKSRDRAPHILEDKDPRVQYDGPLVVLVNSLSASASEIMAAAIQDYGRGVIVGSESTFGKGTVQRFVNLDNFLRGQTDLKPLGEVKLTTQKFYRIDGGATQLRGVVPDIILPDAYSLIDMGEKEREFSMKWDEIEPVPYQAWDATFDLNRLRKNSTQRVETNSTFGLIEENAKRLKSRRDKDHYSLNLATYQAERKAMKKEDAQFEEIEKEISDLQVSMLAVDQQEIAGSEADEDRWNKFIENLGKDPYVYEALMIMKDM
jgi:carboxyl-terminal processing protease